MRFGRHMPTGSKPAEAMRIAQSIGCDSAQIFVTNPRAWRPPAPNVEQETAFRMAAADCGITPVVVHATYLINLASAREDVYHNSVSLLTATLDRAERFGASSVVFHIGSHGGTGEEAGLAQLTKGLRDVLNATPARVMLLLENDTGGGGKLGHRLENLAHVLAQIPEHAERLGVCLDTCHLWGAGFDMSAHDGVDAVLGSADQLIGMARIPVIHLNDAFDAMGRHIDHHARIGEGKIPPEGLRAFLRHPLLRDTAVILETPIPEQRPGIHDWEAERRHMERARELAGLAMPQ